MSPSACLTKRRPEAVLALKGKCSNSSFELMLLLTVDVLPELREESADVLDKYVDDRADRSILQRDDRDRPWPNRKVDRQRLDPCCLPLKCKVRPLVAVMNLPVAHRLYCSGTE